MKSKSQIRDTETPRILLLSNMYPAEKSPAYGIFVKNIYTQLDEAGVDIKKCVIKGQRKTQLGKLSAYTMFLLKAMLRLIFTRRMVYIHFIAHTSLPVIMVSAFRRLNVVAHVHGGDVMAQPQVSEKWTSIKSSMAKRTLKLSSRVIVPSKYFSDFIQKEFSVDLNLVFVSPSGGVNTQRFIPSAREPQRNIQLGYVGRLDIGKGVDTLLKAVKLLTEQEQNIQLTLIGSGREHDRLVQYVANNNLVNVCSFVGSLTQSELATYYQKFDYLIFPSELNESLGLVGLEAMSCGVPVVTPGHAGIGDYFLDEKNGFKYVLGDHVSLSQTLSDLPSVDSDTYRHMARHCRLTALKFDSEVVKEELINELSMLCLNR